jgi:hypothetical protein
MFTPNTINTLILTLQPYHSGAVVLQGFPRHRTFSGFPAEEESTPTNCPHDALSMAVLVLPSPTRGSSKCEAGE